MATKIAPTPVLKGKEAERFWKEELQNRTKYASLKDVRKAVMIYLSVVKNNKKLVG